MSSPLPSPTPEQSSIIKAASSGSLMIRAYAGTAKTTTLQMAASQVRRLALALAFNKRIADELRPRLPSHFAVKTLNGLGHLAWARANPQIAKMTLDDRKLGKLVTSSAKNQRTDLPSDLWDQTRQLVSAAMRAGITPGNQHDFLMEDSEENWHLIADHLFIDRDDIPVCVEIAQEVLSRSIELSCQGIISFDDQIYCSVCLGGKFPQYPLVAVDEAQDLDPLNHIMLTKACLDSLWVVGDPFQAIYAFRGADSSSMENLRKLRPEWIDRKLTLTFRCPKVVVQRQQAHAPGFEAFEKNPSGQFTQLPSGTDAADGWTWKDINNIAAEFHLESVAVLCRNNAPLLSLAFKLLRRKVGVVMLGRDIGKGLVTLSRKLLPDDHLSPDSCRGLILDWMSREVELARINDRLEKVDGISDRGECLLAVLDSSDGRDAGELRRMLEHLFSREYGLVTLSSIHRAKGLEFDLVIHLDPWRIPSRQSRGNPTALQQEMNLRYVCETRSRHTLINANLEYFQ